MVENSETGHDHGKETPALADFRIYLHGLYKKRRLIRGILGQSQDRGELEPRGASENHLVLQALADLGITSLFELETRITIAEQRVKATRQNIVGTLVVSTPLLLSVDPIRNAPVINPSTWEQIELIIETPLRAAMHDFWEKDIRTIESSANGEDAIVGTVFFDLLGGDKLSLRNHEIAQSLGGRNRIKRGLPVYNFKNTVHEGTETKEVVTWSRGITAQFESQK